MRRLLLAGLSCISLNLAAQNATIKKVELAGDKVIVYFDLEDSNSTNEYMLNLYSSKDNFAAPLTKVKGDVGTEVKPGIGKKIEWNIVEEYGAYKGRLALEVRGKVYVAFAKLKDFEADRSYKRGKSYEIFWKAGGTNPVNVEFFKGNQRILGEMNHANNGEFTLYIPSNAKPGKDYRIKISDSKNSNDVIYTPFFKVTPKLPLLVKVLPVVAVAGVAAALGGGGKAAGGGTGTTQNGPIPEPGFPK